MAVTTSAIQKLDCFQILINALFAVHLRQNDGLSSSFEPKVLAGGRGRKALDPGSAL